MASTSRSTPPATPTSPATPARPGSPPPAPSRRAPAGRPAAWPGVSPTPSCSSSARPATTSCTPRSWAAATPTRGGHHGRRRGRGLRTGTTNSPNFPVKAGLQERKDSDTDAFVTQINPAGSELVYSTYLGGGGREQRDGDHGRSGRQRHRGGRHRVLQLPHRQAPPGSQGRRRHRRLRVDAGRRGGHPGVLQLPGRAGGRPGGRGSRSGRGRPRRSWSAPPAGRLPHLQAPPVGPGRKHRRRLRHPGVGRRRSVAGHLLRRHRGAGHDRPGRVGHPRQAGAPAGGDHRHALPHRRPAERPTSAARRRPRPPTGAVRSSRRRSSRRRRPRRGGVACV